MAETSKKRITLSNFFEQIVEIDKVANKALKQSNESVSISERTKLDLERLIQTLRITFDGDSANVQPAGSVTNITQNNKEITKIIREDAIEDREIRDAFTQLQTSFNNLTNIVYVLRNDLQSTTGALLQMQQGRSRMLREQGRVVSKEEDTLQKEQILGVKQKQQTQQVQDQKRQQEQKENKTLSALKQFLGGGLLTGIGLGLGGDGGGGGAGGDITDVTADTPQERALLKTIRGSEGTGGKGGYGKIFGGEVVPELEQGKLTIEEAARMSETGKLPDRLGGRTVPYGRYKGKISGATGAYQFMPGTMRQAARRANIPLDTPLTPAVQDQLGLSNVRMTGVDPSKPATAKTLRQLEGQWTGLGSSQGGAGIDYNYQRYQRELKKEQQKQVQINKAADTLKDLDKLTKPMVVPGAEPVTPTMPFTLSPIYSPQSYLSPEEKRQMMDLKVAEPSISSITLPAIDAGSQQVGGQGRGQAATHSYAVNSAKNEMMFAQVLTTSFSDKMNIAMG